MYTLPCAHNYTHIATLLGKFQWVLVSRVCMVLAGYLTWALCSVWHLWLELMTHSSLMETKFMFRLASSVDVAVNQCVMFPSWHWGALFIYSQTLMSCMCLSGSSTWFTFFSFCPYIPPNPFLPPFWSRCTVIPLPSHLLHPHAHLLSVSRWATFWSRERTSDEKESLLFNQILLWSHPHFQYPCFMCCLENLHCTNVGDVS